MGAQCNKWSYTLYDLITQGGRKDHSLGEEIHTHVVVKIVNRLVTILQDFMDTGIILEN